MRIGIGVVLLVILACCDGKIKSDDHRKNDSLVVKQNGVLIFHTDSIDADSEFALLNNDRTKYCRITSRENDSVSVLLTEHILAYYPDYFIVHFAVESFDSIYYVEVGNEKKLVKPSKFIEFMTWPNYIQRFFSKTTGKNPLRVEPKDSGSVVTGIDYRRANFRNVEVKGDWVRVVCNLDCDGCINNRVVEGWIRWREGDKVVLDIYYAC